jgi:hypothetical protein
MIFAAEQSSWSFGPWTSNASFIYCGLEGQRVTHFILCAGSFARLKGQSVFAHRDKVDRLEWTKRAGTRQAVSSDEGALKTFSAGALEDSDSVF